MFIKLTQPWGKKIPMYVRPASIIAMNRAESRSGHHTEITFAGGEHGTLIVSETPEEIMELIEQAEIA